MKVLAVRSARAIWLVPTLLLNPKGLHLGPVFEQLASRYLFAKLPEPKDITSSPLNLIFQDGSFQSRTNDPIYASLSVHDDGIVADTRSSTSESDRFLDDVLTWFSQEFGFPRYSTLGVRRLYVSELVVEMNLSNSFFSDEVMEFLAALRNSMGVTGRGVEFSSISFSADPTATRTAAPFRVERLANALFKENRYLCSAPLQSDEHLKLLKLMAVASEG